MKIGIIGLGRMGIAIAERLLGQGHELTVYNRTAGKAAGLVELGAHLAESPSAAASGDIVITMLADDHAVENVVLLGGAESLVGQQGKDTVHISMSTVSPELIRRIAETSNREGKPFISATVMGRPEVAARGELVVMAAGSEELIERCRPALLSIGKSVHMVGRNAEQSNIAKVTANFMLSCTIEMFAEAFALIRKNGIDHHQFLDIIAKEFFQSPILHKYGTIIADEKFASEAFTVRLQEKDTRLALDLSIKSQVPMPLAALVENAFLSAIGRGKGDLDPCAIAQVAYENAGLDTTAKIKA